MERVGLVLGGGGLKGLAHVGALRALEESGFEISVIVGTSIGALVGAGYAAGVSVAALEGRARELTRSDIVGLNRWAFLLNGLRQPSVFRSNPFMEYIRRVLPVESFADLSLPMEMNAVDLETGVETWFGGKGRTDVPLAEAVYASAALPVFYPPAEIDGRYYVDGGVASSLPVSRVRIHEADRVIAVDVAAGETKDPLDTLAKGLVAVHHRVYDIMNHARTRDRLEHWDGPPLTHVRPHLDGHSTFDFKSAEFFLAEGRRATLEALGLPAPARARAG